MTDKPFYPTVSEGALMAIQAALLQMKKHPRYLEEEECPYTEKVKEFLHSLTVPVSLDTENLTSSIESLDEYMSGDKNKWLESQVLSLINDIEAFNRSLRTKDNKEKLDFFKMKNVLIEKLISSQERVWNMREMSEFQSIILQFIEEECDKDQVNKLMKKLANLESLENK